MSDDCETYYNAWKKVMGESDNRLLCSWHVDRAWRRNINSKVHGDMFLKTDVYKALKVVQMQTEQQRFCEMLEGFTSWTLMDERMRDFGLYFVSNYVGRELMWAFCFRAGLGLNTNMYLEAHHKTLKYNYLMKKVNNRVDKAIQALLQRTKNTHFDMIRRLAKGTLKTGRIAAITSSHKKCGQIRPGMITQTEEGTWHVQRLGGGPQYTVTSTDTTCLGCPLSCTQCKVNPHVFNICMATNLNCFCCQNLWLSNVVVWYFCIKYAFFN